MIEANNLSVTYSQGDSSTPALGPLSFRVTPGEFVSFVGPSGSGKTTLARALAGILVPTSGDLTVGEGDKPVVSTVFQDYGVFPWKTAMQNMEFPLRERGFDKNDARSIAREWLERLRIGQFETFYPRQLSGGMKQRLAIARALSVSPNLLILDEPFAAIDAQLRETLQDELLALHQETGMTTVLFTHSFDEAVLLSDRIVVLTPRPATILDIVTVPFARPRSADVRREPAFLDTVSTVRAAIKRGAHD